MIFGPAGAITGYIVSEIEIWRLPNKTGMEEFLAGELVGGFLLIAMGLRFYTNP
jgi:hypothetical protein